MIDPKAEPIAGEHRNPYKRVDLAARRPRPSIITRKQIENNEYSVPDPEFYWCDQSGNWHLKVGI